MEQHNPSVLHKLVREVWKNRVDLGLCNIILGKIRAIASQHPLADATIHAYHIYYLNVLKGDDDRRAYGFARSYGEDYLAFCVRRKFYG